MESLSSKFSSSSFICIISSYFDSFAYASCNAVPSVSPSLFVSVVAPISFSVSQNPVKQRTHNHTGNILIYFISLYPPFSLSSHTQCYNQICIIHTKKFIVANNRIITFRSMHYIFFCTHILTTPQYESSFFCITVIFK